MRTERREDGMLRDVDAAMSDKFDSCDVFVS